MDLMTNVTTYAQLQKKYNGFAAPTYRILVDGVELGEKLHSRVSALTVELTTGYEASGATFDIIDQYVYNQTNFNSKGAFKVLQLGAKVEIELGYIKTEKIFMGLITEVSYIFDGEHSPHIHVECMDAKCLLMKIQRLEIRKETKISQIITALLGEQPISSYISGKTVTLMGPTATAVQINMESDYEFIVKQAQYTGCEFFIVAGKVYFRDSVTMTTPIYTISPKTGLYSGSFSLRGSGLVKDLQVVGINPENDEAVTGKGVLGGKFSTGATSKKMLNKTIRTYFDSRVNSVSDANKRAKVLVKSIQNDFGLFEGSCLGNPEIVPGRHIKVDGLMDLVKKSFYITSVRHIFDEGGFTTYFEGRVGTL